MPWPGWAMTTSDQRVSRRRSACGISKSVASVIAVSSIETLSTQSNGSPIGNESRIAAARSRISGSITARLVGETAGLTVLRCSSCLGGSMAMNMRGPPPPWPSWPGGGPKRPEPGPGPPPVSIIFCTRASLGGSVMPPSEENTSWLVSTAMMSLYLVTPQWAALSPSGVQCTGSSARSRSKAGHMASAWNSPGWAGLRLSRGSA